MLQEAVLVKKDIVKIILTAVLMLLFLLFSGLSKQLTRSSMRTAVKIIFTIS